MKFNLFSACLFLFLISCGSDDNTPLTNPTEPVAEKPVEETVTENTENLLLQLNGTQFVDADQNPVYLQGVAFNNFIWFNSIEPHHSEIDYERVSDMGMNAIRFYMNYRYFEDDNNPYTYKQSGWDWLDQNIAWAKKHNIYLVLNMHVPQGGYQSQGEGDALWDDDENQNRLTTLWAAIAERYKDEVQIAGFGPVNEPYPSASINQWSQLAQKLINGIREVNKNHLLFIEQAIQVKGQTQETADFNFPDVTGENLVYEFHGYDPYFYTHQLLEFAALGEGGTYPDENIIETSRSNWYTTIFDNPILAPNTTDWTFYQGERYQIIDANIKIAVPTVGSTNIVGTVYFDDMLIKEYDENGAFVRDIPNINLNDENGWFYWSENDSGTGGLSTEEGRTDNNSLFVSGATANSNMGNFNKSFAPKQNYFYEVSGWMKGTDAAADNEAAFRLDFYTANQVLVRNKTYLETEIDNIVEWAKGKNTALYMGEFGAGYPCFQDNKGGLQFVADMTDILKISNIHFTYHAYHEDAFGLYLGDGLPNPSNVNQPLIDWFTMNLN